MTAPRTIWSAPPDGASPLDGLAMWLATLAETIATAPAGAAQAAACTVALRVALRDLPPDALAHLRDLLACGAAIQDQLGSFIQHRICRQQGIPQINHQPVRLAHLLDRIEACACEAFATLQQRLRRARAEARAIERADRALRDGRAVVTLDDTVLLLAPLAEDKPAASAGPAA